MTRHDTDDAASHRVLPRSRAATALAAASIAVACLSIVWNLASLGVLAKAQRQHMDREQEQNIVAAQQEALENENQVAWADPPEVTVGTATILAACVSLFSLHILLGGLLFAAGVGLLRGSPRARSTHLSFAYIKIPLTVLSGFAWLWILGREGELRGFSYAWALLAMVLGCIYPLALFRIWRDPARRASGIGA